jgi:hypothetical protein
MTSSVRDEEEKGESAARPRSNKGKRKEKKGKAKSLTLEEDLEDASGLLVDQARDTLDTSSSSKSSDGGLGDTLAVEGESETRKGNASAEVSSVDLQVTETGEGDEHVVSQDLPVSLGSSLAETLST